MFTVTKMFGAERTYSCCFRNWRATDSHCSYLHGYSLKFEVIFAAEVRDDKGWVINFGSFKHLRDKLRAMFDHKTIAATDDPMLPVYKALASGGVAQLTLMAHVSCEDFAEVVYAESVKFLETYYKSDMGSRGLRVFGVRVYENDTNSAGVFYPRGRSPTQDNGQLQADMFNSWIDKLSTK